jgi:hypothetical protein
MESDTRVIPLELADGTIVQVEVTPIGEQQVGFQKRPFKEATEAIRAVAKELANELTGALQEAKPNKISVKFGLEIALESGELTTLLVKGSGKANLEITLEWGQQ